MSVAMMAITTRSSTNVNPRHPGLAILPAAHRSLFIIEMTRVTRCPELPRLFTPRVIYTFRLPPRKPRRGVIPAIHAAHPAADRTADTR